MQQIQRRNLVSNSTIRRLWLGCLSLSFTAILALAVTSNAFTQAMAEAEETFSTVTWYLKGGYWRDDVQVYLTHAEYLLSPSKSVEIRLELAEDE